VLWCNIKRLRARGRAKIVKTEFYPLFYGGGVIRS